MKDLIELCVVYFYPFNRFNREISNVLFHIHIYILLMSYATVHVGYQLALNNVTMGRRLWFERGGNDYNNKMQSLRKE